MYNQRQLILVRSLALAGLRLPDTDFALARELIEIGTVADAAIARLAQEAQRAALLADPEAIAPARAGGAAGLTSDAA